MKVFTRIGIFLLIVFLGIQFVPTTRNESGEVLATDFVRAFEPPESIGNMLKVSCYNCHSNNTAYPWYNEVQPISWFLEGHIKEAKKELNFSEFGNYSTRKKKSKLKSIISQIKDGKMPLSSYTFIHKDARLSDSDKLELEKWLSELKAGL